MEMDTPLNIPRLMPSFNALKAYNVRQMAVDERPSLVLLLRPSSPRISSLFPSSRSLAQRFPFERFIGPLGSLEQ
ncbi:hypothetical protein CC2G_003366 [Coprinopsis cinerea AmutBmut pab1-1]|nr:hypothetical protein CC2G_003366 [Coprinopsis cinerea AmutBmut pab1-1]